MKMMAPTLREHLKNEWTPDNGDDEFRWRVLEYYSEKGMEWTPDDEKVIKEYGYDPQNYLCFDEEQEMQIDSVLEAVHNLVDVMIAPENTTKFTDADAILLSDVIANFLVGRGCKVYYPNHVECDDGTQYITDFYE